MNKRGRSVVRTAAMVALLSLGACRGARALRCRLNRLRSGADAIPMWHPAMLSRDTLATALRMASAVPSSLAGGSVAPRTA